MTAEPESFLQQIAEDMELMRSMEELTREVFE